MATAPRPLSAVAMLVFALFLQERAVAENTNQLELTYIESKEVGTVAVLLVRLSAAMSILGSCYILFSLIGTKQKRSTQLKLPLNRLLLMTSIYDVISSTFMFMGSWLVPSSPPCDFEGDAEAEALAQEYWDIHYPNAIGNVSTCTAQGFLIQIGVLGSTCFTAFVGLQTLLVVRYNYKIQQMKKAEIIFFGIGLFFPLVPAIWALEDELYNPLNFGGCWLSTFPLKIFLDTHPSINQYCGKGIPRGQKIEIKRIALIFGWAIILVLLMIGSMISLFLFVRKQEGRVSRWSIAASEGRQQRKVLSKAMMYISAYLILFSYWFVYPILRFHIEFDTFGTVCSASQGSLNALIYSGILEKHINRFCCCCCFGSKEECSDAEAEDSFAIRRISHSTQLDSHPTQPASKSSADTGVYSA